MKEHVLARVKQAHWWLANNVHGQLTQLVPLLFDVMQELEAQSTALWMQTSIGPGRHVKVFVEGEMDLEAIQTLIEYLKLAESTAERRKHRLESATQTAAVDPVPVNSSESSTRD